MLIVDYLKKENAYRAMQEIKFVFENGGTQQLRCRYHMHMQTMIPLAIPMPVVFPGGKFSMPKMTSVYVGNVPEFYTE